jgi:hypothetical protein
MRTIAALALLLFPALQWAEVLDRIAVTVGREIITLTEILLEIRLQAFQEGKPVDTGKEALRAAADRLVDRTLIQMEMDVNRFPMADRVDAVAELDEVKKRFPEPGSFEAALKKYRITEDDLIDRLQLQLTIARFIDFRFQVADQPSAADIENYYRDTFVPMARKAGITPIPGLDEQVRSKIEEILVKNRVNAAMEKWLEQARARTAIQFHEGAFA